MHHALWHAFFFSCTLAWIYFHSPYSFGTWIFL
jgi:hypothetical protein